MAERAILIRARWHMHLAQWEAAELLNVETSTYQRWEYGKTKPKLAHWRRIHKVFGTTLEQGGILYNWFVSFKATPKESVLEEQDTSAPDTSEDDSFLSTMIADLEKEDAERRIEGDTPFLSNLTTDLEKEDAGLIEDDDPFDSYWSTDREREEAERIEAEEIPDVIQAFIEADMTMKLLSLIFQDHSTWTSKCAAIRQAIEKFDATKATEENYPTIRREALWRVAMFSVVTLGLLDPERTLQPDRYEFAFKQCAGCLEVCRELRLGDASDRALAYECILQNLFVLLTIAETPVQGCEEAAQVAEQYRALELAFLRT